MAPPGAPFLVLLVGRGVRGMLQEAPSGARVCVCECVSVCMARCCERAQCVLVWCESVRVCGTRDVRARCGVRAT